MREAAANDGASSRAPEGVALSEVVSDLRGLIHIDPGTDLTLARRAMRVVFFEPESPQSLGPGDIVMAPAQSGDATLSDICGALTEAGCTALVTRVRPTDESATPRLCAEGNLVLMSLNVGVTWERLYSLLQASLGSRAWQTADDVGSGIRLGDMFELASALEHLVGGHIILEDAYFRVLSYSADSGDSDSGRQRAILARQIPPEWMAHLRREGILERLRSTDEVIRLPDGPLDARPRLITSVRAGNDLVGIIWVAESGDRPLDPAAEERLAEGRRIALPHFQRFLAADRLGDLRRGELLRVLLREGGSIPLIAEGLGLDVGTEVSLLALEDGTTSGGMGRRELLPALLESYDARATVTVLDNTVYALVRVRDSRDLDRLRRIAARCTDQLAEQSRLPVRCVVSGPRPLSSDFEHALSEVRTLLQIASRRGRDTAVLVGWELESELLIERAEALLRADGRFTFSKVLLLEEHDRRSSSDLTGTLAAYLAAHEEVSRAAEALQVHQTTVRYRLRRVAEISRIDLSDPRDGLAARLHLLAGGRMRSRPL